MSLITNALAETAELTPALAGLTPEETAFAVGLSTALGLLRCALAAVWTFLFFLFQTAGLYYLSPSYSWRPRAEEFSPKEEPTWESHEGTKGTPVHGILEGQGGSTLKS